MVSRGRGRRRAGRTPKDYPCHVFCDKNTSSDVWGEGGKTLCCIQEKCMLSGTLEAPSLQERTEQGPCREDSVFPPPVAAVKTHWGPETFSISLSSMFSHSAWLKYLLFSVSLCYFTQLPGAHSRTKYCVVTSCCNILICSFHCLLSCQYVLWFSVQTRKVGL